jgi:hypothetical protein
MFWEYPVVHHKNTRGKAGTNLFNCFIDRLTMECF